MASCDDCGTMFDTNHDVQRHIKEKCCPAHNKRGHPHEQDNLPPPKRPVSFDDWSSGDEEVEDNATFQALWNRVGQDSKDLWEKKVQA